MEILLPIITGVLYTAGLLLILHRSFMKMILGIVVMGHATNLFLFIISGIFREPPLLEKGQTDISGMADPVPQALILTAIVIGFGIQTFAIVLLKRAYKVKDTDDLDELVQTDNLK